MDPLQSFDSWLRALGGKGPRTLMVAVSGGADSVALLRAAALAGPRRGWSVEALHCDHGLRGRESDRDRDFVRALCSALAVPLLVFQGKLKGGVGLEARARVWRRRCYAQAAQERGATLVLLAHHAQDQAETLLLNLLRGCGPAGAAGMLSLSPLENGAKLRLGRPFLSLSPLALRQWLHRLKQPWREDRSNRDPKHVRNYLRHKVLPLLKGVNPKAVEHLAAFALDLAPAKASGQRELAGLLRLDRAARVRARTLIASGQGSADLGRGWTLDLSAGQARLSKTDPFAALALKEGSVTWGQGWRIQVKRGRRSARKWDDSKAFWFSPEFLKARPRLRAARPGERFRPFGLKGSRLVFDALADAKVPAWARSSWPVLEAGGKIVAVLGCRRGQGWECLGYQGISVAWKRPRLQA